MVSFLQVDGLTKSFGDLVLFENITFGVAQGPVSYTHLTLPTIA